LHPVVLLRVSQPKFVLCELCSISTTANRILRIIIGMGRDEVTGVWRKLHNEELHNLYSSPSIIRIMKSRKIRWAGHVT
jgi:hypothetical protein